MNTPKFEGKRSRVLFNRGADQGPEIADYYKLQRPEHGMQNLQNPN